MIIIVSKIKAFELEAHDGNGPFEWMSSVDNQHETHDYFKLPHPHGPSSNCGSPLSKNYLHLIKNGVLRYNFHLVVCFYTTYMNTILVVCDIII